MVRPGGACGGHSVASGQGLRRATAGQEATFSISAYDEFGQQKRTGTIGSKQLTLSHVPNCVFIEKHSLQGVTLGILRSLFYYIAHQVEIISRVRCA